MVLLLIPLYKEENWRPKRSHNFPKLKHLLKEGTKTIPGGFAFLTTPHTACPLTTPPAHTIHWIR